MQDYTNSSAKGQVFHKNQLRDVSPKPHQNLAFDPVLDSSPRFQKNIFGQNRGQSQRTGSVGIGYRNAIRASQGPKKTSLNLSQATHRVSMESNIYERSKLDNLSFRALQSEQGLLVDEKNSQSRISQNTTSKQKFKASKISDFGTDGQELLKNLQQQASARQKFRVPDVTVQQGAPGQSNQTGSMNQTIRNQPNGQAKFATYGKDIDDGQKVSFCGEGKEACNLI